MILRRRSGWFVVYWCAMTASAGASFEEIGTAARPWGMANAYSALALDHLALFYNPAGLVDVQATELGTGYNRYWLGLTDQSNIGSGHLAIAMPFNMLSAGFPGGIGASFLTTYLAGAYSEQTIALGYGVEVSSGYAIGSVLKLLSTSVTLDPYLASDPVFSGSNSTNGIAVDVGAMVRVIPSWNFSFAATNLISPNLALKGSDAPPLRLKAGLAYRMPGWDFTLDGTVESGELTVAGGTEKRFGDRMYFLRGGMALGAREYRVITVGAGVNFRTLQIDYGFFLPLTGPTGAGGSHRVSMVVRFGQPMTQSETDFQPQHLVNKEAYDETLSKLKLALEKTLAEVERLQKSNQNLQKTNDENRAMLDKAMQLTIELSQKIDQVEREAKKVKVVERIVERQPPPPPKPIRPATYTVQEGDTLKSIAKALYGDEEKWDDLLKANQDHIRQGMVVPGQVLVVP